MLAVPLWIGIWWSATGFRLMRHNRLLALPFLLQDRLRHGDAEVTLLGGLHDVPRSERQSEADTENRGS